MSRIIVAIPVIVGLIVGGCVIAPPPEPAQKAASTRFICDRSQTLLVSFMPREAIIEDAYGTRTRLQARPVASGFDYASNGVGLRGKGPELSWSRPGVPTPTCREEAWAMQQPQIQPPQTGASLAGSRWMLEAFTSSDDAVGRVVPPRVDRYTFEFKPDGALAMQLDCNRASATWSATSVSPADGSLSLKSGMMTRAMCPPGSLDAQIARDLQRIRSFTLRDGKLSLALEADAGIYTLVPWAE